MTTDHVDAPARPVDRPAVGEPFEVPRLVPLGEAARVVRNDGSGHLKDGIYGWWVWNS